jgi:glutamate--cysteine ligase
MIKNSADLQHISKPMKPTDNINPDTDFACYFAENGKPANAWAIGPEIELFGFTRDTLERIKPVQVQAIIEGFSEEIAESAQENGFLVEATLKDKSRITLEPGGQIEFSGAPQQSLIEIERTLENYVSRLKAIGDRLGIIFIAAGFDPLRKLEEQQWISKSRYDIMRPYLAQRGKRAWDMMCRTSAIQVNLDYSDLEDLAKKFSLATRLAPVAAAMFANSPFADGKLSGYKSTRYAAWLETDSDRTGAALCAIDGDFSIARFVDYVKCVPMFFIRRKGKLINLAGYNFKEFLARGAHGYTPILQDFTDHLSTIFTEARLKPYIEQRSMDCGNIAQMMMAMAFWKGLLYDRDALDEALQIAPKMNHEQYAALQLEVARHGLQAKRNEIGVYDLAKAAIEIAAAGLKRLAPEEGFYLDALKEDVATRKSCPADFLITMFHRKDGVSAISENGNIRQAMEYMKIKEHGLLMAGNV